VSTRKLIIAALLCGLLILVAGAFQLVQIANSRNHSSVSSSAGSGVPAP
jgi:hypothetical protein